MKPIFPLLPAALAAMLARDADAVQWRVTALTPEYLLVQADITDEESTAFFADPRTEEALRTTPDWKARLARIGVPVPDGAPADPADAAPKRGSACRPDGTGC